MVEEIKYRGSQLETSINCCSEQEYLINKRRYISAAVSSHKAGGDKVNELFFTEALSHINKKIK